MGAFGARDAGRAIVTAPEDEGLAVFEPGPQVTSEGLAATEMDHRRRSGIAGQVLGGIVAGIGPAVALVVSAHGPAVLPLGPECPVDQVLEVVADLGDGEEGVP